MGKMSINLHEVIHVSDDLRHELMKSSIEPFYKEMVDASIRRKFFWRRTGVVLEASSKVMIVAASVISFSTSYFEERKDALSFVAGTVGCLSLGAIQCAAFAYKEHSRQAQELNSILRQLRIEEVPVGRRLKISPNVKTYRDEVHF